MDVVIGGSSCILVIKDGGMGGGVFAGGLGDGLGSGMHDELLQGFIVDIQLFCDVHLFT